MCSRRSTSACGASGLNRAPCCGVPSHLHIDSTSGPFRRLSIDWRFTPGAEGGCLTALTVEIEMRSVLLETFAGRLMQMMTQDILERFRARAAVLYG